jgi:uncharacterized protein YdhG (YjbR/CyaY superfamily)
MNQNKIIEKLVKIAETQQKVLAKLAQKTDPKVQENISLLQRAWQSAALNSGVTQVQTPNVSYNPSKQVDDTILEDSYIVSGKIPADKRNAMDTNIHKQVKLQKPELAEKVSFIYED